MYRSILNSKVIYGSSQKAAALIILFVVLALGSLPFLVIFISFSGSPALGNLLLVIGAATILALIFAIIKAISHGRKIKNLFKRRRYLTAAAGDFNSHIFKTVVHSEFDGKDDKIRFKIIDDLTLIGQPNWPPSVLGEKARYRLYDMTADIYRDGKHGKSKVAERYYTILEIKLRKPVPHLVFDSKSANKQQFKSIYVSSQKLAAADLDQHFTLYSPKHHSVETLSFITPEVIEAMIGLRDCDFEFIGDSLFCYAPLLNETELAGLRQRGLLLHAKVNDNLPRYTFTDTQVDEFGRQLLKNPWRYLPAAITSALMTTVLWFLMVSSGFEARALVYVIVGFFGFVGSVIAIVNTKRKNKRLEEEFLRRRTGQ